MSFSRRSFLHLAVSGLATATYGELLPVALGAQRRARFKVGVTDWNLKQTAKLDSIALAKRLGFDGVQVSIG
ncbi:MAG: hypothetical protein ABI882_18545, partial [Acidobacteriota bacterium]